MMLVEVANLGLDLWRRDSAGVCGRMVAGLAVVWSGGWCWAEGGIHDLGKLWMSRLDPL